MMEKTVFTFIAFYFAIGALAIALINRKHDKQSRHERWTKYFVYLLIVNVIVLGVLYGFFHFIAIATVAAGLYEMLLTVRNLPRLLNRILAILIFGLLSFGFMKYAFLSDTHAQLFVYMLVFIFDGFSQITGQLIGKRKFIPAISPGKTIEGAMGGLLISLFTAILLKQLIGLDVTETFVLGLGICLFAFGGDLLASYYKRKCKIKDFSQLIPGHGGVLDRFDSFIVAGTFYWIITIF